MCKLWSVRLSIGNVVGAGNAPHPLTKYFWQIWLHLGKSNLLWEKSKSLIPKHIQSPTAMALGSVVDHYFSI